MDDINSAAVSKEKYIGSLYEYRAELLTLTKESQSAYDKVIITVCSGAIVATIGLYDKLPDETPPIGILIAWVFWSLGLVAITVSFLAATKSASETLASLDKYLSRDRQRQFKSKDGFWCRAVTWSNGLGFAFLFLGVLSFSASLAWGIMQQYPNYERQVEIWGRAKGHEATAPTSKTPNRGGDPTSAASSPATEEEQIVSE